MRLQEGWIVAAIIEFPQREVREEAHSVDTPFDLDQRPKEGKAWARTILIFIRILKHWEAQDVEMEFSVYLNALENAWHMKDPMLGIPPLQAWYCSVEDPEE